MLAGRLAHAQVGVQTSEGPPEGGIPAGLARPIRGSGGIAVGNFERLVLGFFSGAGHGAAGGGGVTAHTGDGVAGGGGQGGGGGHQNENLAHDANSMKAWERP